MSYQRSKPIADGSGILVGPLGAMPRMAHSCYLDEWDHWVCDKPRGGRGRAAMGDVLDTVGGIVTDPGLPETIQLAMRMRALAVAEGGPADTSPGVGLSKINGPLRLYVEARESKWMIPAAIAAVVGLPFLLGLNIGKRRRAP